MVCPKATEAAPHHKILLDNLKENEIITYSLVIIKGHVEYLENCEQSVSVNVLINANDYEKCMHARVDYKNNRFKFPIDLRLGSNIITVACCCSSTSCTLEYKARKTNLVVLPLYIICDGYNGKFQAPETEPNDIKSACKRITVGCKLIQSLFAEKLYDAGFERKTFELDAAGCITFQSKLHFQEVYRMSQIELWYYFAREIMNSYLGGDNKKFLAFLACTKYDGSKYDESLKGHDELLKLTKGYVAFGGNGLALIGIPCLYTWPEYIDDIVFRFKNNLAIDPTQFLDDSCYRGTEGGCFSTSLGAVLHELCHTFDLGHTKSGIMGRGFDNIQNVFLLCPETAAETKFKARLNNMYQYNFKENDNTYWTKSCLVIINYHRWFNNFPEIKKRNLWYDASFKLVKSTSGLRVVEIRRKSDEMLFKEWTFLDKVLKYSFHILYNENSHEQLIVFIEDNVGCILKEDL